jgi:hypothetical protein
VQQSARSVVNESESDDEWPQHGMRAQKPMIALAGAMTVRRRAIASAIVFDVEKIGIRS